MVDMTRRVGIIDWVDLSTRDIDAARLFYAAVLGWEFQTADSAVGQYHLAYVHGHQVAGMMAGESGGAPPAWTTYVRVSSVGETAAAIVNADGSVLAEPFEIPGGAMVAVAADPVGAVFAVISSGPPADADEPPLRRAQHGAVAWSELLTRDPHDAAEFYDMVFGWQSTAVAESGYMVLRLNDEDVAGMLPMPTTVPPEAPSHWMVYFNVVDLTAAVTTARQAGGACLVEPTTVGEMTFAVVADPSGASFGLLANPSAA